MISKHSYSQLQVLLVEPSHTQQLIINNFLQKAGVTNVIGINTDFEALQEIPQLLPELLSALCILNRVLLKNLITRLMN